MAVISTIQLKQEDIGKMGPEDTQSAIESIPNLRRRLDEIESLLRARAAFHVDDAYFVLVREGERYYVLGAIPEFEVSWPPCLVTVRKSEIKPELDIVDVEISGTIHHLTPGGPSQSFTLSYKGIAPQLFELQAFRSRADAMAALGDSSPDSFDADLPSRQQAAESSGTVVSDGEDSPTVAILAPTPASGTSREAVPTVPAPASSPPGSAEGKVPSAPPVASGFPPVPSPPSPTSGRSNPPST